jgi:hypothetical protein
MKCLEWVALDCDSKGASLELKGKRACVRSSTLYGSETWPKKVEDKQRLERAERMMARHVWSYTEGQVSCEELKQRLGIDNVSDVLRRLRWYGRVQRKDDGDCVRACQR